MRGLLLGAVIVGMAWAIPAEAFPLATPGVDNVECTLLTKVGWRRQYWRHGDAVLTSTLQLMAIMRLPTHTHDPPARGYYVPVPPNGDYPVADGDYADYPPAEVTIRVARATTPMVRLRAGDQSSSHLGKG